MTILWLPDNCPTTPWWLRDSCLKANLQLPDNCLTTAWWMTNACRLLDNCLMNAWQLPDNCLMNAWRMPDNCLKVKKSVYHNKNLLIGQPISSLSSWHCFWPSHLNKMEIQSPFPHWNSFVFAPKKYEENGILFQKLFSPTLRKKIVLMTKKPFEFTKFWRSLEQLKSQNNFWNRIIFLTI